MGKTSTFTIDHDRCNPAEWKPADVLALAEFIQTGNLGFAAHMSKLGMKLVMSEHHEPMGGHLEQVAYAPVDPKDGHAYLDTSGELDEMCDDDNVFAVARIYRGPTRYAVRIPIGDHEGNFEGHEYETFPSEVVAIDFLRSLAEPPDKDEPYDGFPTEETQDGEH